MAEAAEKIDSSQMKILSEFSVEYENDEEITKPDSAEKKKVFLCSLDENVIVAYQSRITGRIVSVIVFEKDNAFEVGKTINKILDSREPWSEPAEIEEGKDKILITYSSSWAHNLPAPLERINVYNRRNYELDELRAQDMWLSLPPKMAKKFADEIEKQFGKT